MSIDWQRTSGGCVGGSGSGWLDGYGCWRVGCCVEVRVGRQRPGWGVGSLSVRGCLRFGGGVWCVWSREQSARHCSIKRVSEISVCVWFAQQTRQVRCSPQGSVDVAALAGSLESPR